jgi:hypothetical protein
MPEFLVSQISCPGGGHAILTLRDESARERIVVVPWDRLTSDAPSAEYGGDELIYDRIKQSIDTEQARDSRLTAKQALERRVGGRFR